MERYNRKRGNMKLAGMLLKNSIPAFIFALYINNIELRCGIWWNALLSNIISTTILE